MKIIRYLGLILGCGAVMAACQSLDVPNTNNPALTESLATPTNVEMFVGSAFKYWHAQTMDNDFRQGVSLWTTIGLAGNADEITDMVGNDNFENVAMEPKQTMDHHDAGFWLNRVPWANYYSAIATCKDVIETLDKGMKLGDISEAFPNGRNTDRARWMCWFVMGASHAYLASLYDKVLLVSPGVTRDLYDTTFVTPAEAQAHGIAQIEKAIEIAQASVDDATPTTWINGQTYTRDEFIQVMHSYLARIRAFVARNTDERAAVDWAKVIADVDAGIKDNFHPVTASSFAGRSVLCPTAGGLCGGAFVISSDRTIGGTGDYYKRWTYGTANNNPRIAQRFLGPGDTTGAYQWWESRATVTDISDRKDTLYASPDKRIHLTTATSAGRYFSRGGAPPSNLGSWVWSRYLFSRFGTTSTTASNAYRDSINATLTRTEMDLLKAEALIRTGNAAAAVPLINKTRTGVKCIANVGGAPCTVATNEAGTYGGNLPPVTVAGPPAGASCVPRRVDGSCGDLMDALMWEKRLESVGIEVIINWSDWRAWGKFQPGTWLAMPIHSRELFTLGIPYYSFGGTLPGSVGAPGTDYTRVP